MSVRAETLLDRFPSLLRFVTGDKTVEISGPSAQDNPQPGAIAFVSEESHLQNLLNSDVAAIVVHEKLTAKINGKAGYKAILSSVNPYLAMAQVNAEFFPLNLTRTVYNSERVHPSAVISPSATLADDVVIGPHVTIGPDVTIGSGSYIGANTVIEARSRLGKNCMIHPQVYIGHSCELGDHVEIKPQTCLGGDGYGYAHDEKGNHYRLTHYGKVIVGDDVHIGANVSLDRGTYEPSTIGAGTKIDNHCHFGHNIQIGRNCLITAGMITAGSVKIGDNCVFAGRVSVNGHIEITSGTTVGPMAGVTGSVTEPGTYGGFPLLKFNDFRRVQASLSSLPRLRKQVAKLLKAVGIKDEAHDG